VPAAKDTVLVVDDDAAFRALVRRLLEHAGFAIAEAADADEALAAVEHTRPDLVLLDVRFPLVSGYELYRRLRDRLGDALPIVFVSGERTDSYDRIAGLLLGADDYVLKPFDPDELTARMRRLIARGSNGTAPDDADELISELTSRERQVLGLLATGRGSKQIALELVISPRTVGTHIQHILAKLGVHSRAQAVALAHRAGLVPPEADAHAQAANSSPPPERLAS
jgi:two-component system nitrate/nitrite response regulator NarL